MSETPRTDKLMHELFAGIPITPRVWALRDLSVSMERALASANATIESIKRRIFGERYAQNRNERADMAVAHVLQQLDAARADLTAANESRKRLRDEIEQLRLIAASMTVSNVGIMSDNIKERARAALDAEKE